MGTVEDFVELVKARWVTLYGEFAQARGVVAIARLFGPVIGLVEQLALEGKKLTGAEKKEAAIKLLNELIDVPILPEWLEAKIIGLVIDSVVAAFNSLFGKSWGQSSTLPTPAALGIGINGHAE